MDRIGRTTFEPAFGGSIGAALLCAWAVGTAMAALPARAQEDPVPNAAAMDAAKPDPAPLTEMRTWTLARGRRIEGALLRVVQDIAILEVARGPRAAISVSAFSMPDQDLIAELTQPAPVEAADPEAVPEEDPAPAEVDSGPRVWTLTGGRTFTGTLLRLLQNIAILDVDDGPHAVVSLSLLSPEDLEHIDALMMAGIGLAPLTDTP